jgi:transcription elongation factor GreA
MDENTYLTKDGASQLKKELENLKGFVREQLAKRLRAAIQQGDLTENADYITAKEEQSFVEGRIQDLENILKHVIIIDDLNISKDHVEIGTHVTVQEVGSTPEEFFLIGPQEADPSRGRISFESPLGSALMNCRVGDIVNIETPEGKTSFKIIRIE